MIQAPYLGAHWPVLLTSRGPDAPDSFVLRMERALAAAGAVAWEWNVRTGESSLSAGEASLVDLKDDPADGFYGLVHHLDRGWLRRAVAQAAAGEQPYDFEFRLRGEDGRTEWVHDRGELERSASGRPLRLAGVAQLVTARKRTEAALAATLEQAAVGMAHVAPNGTFLKLNDCLCRILGRPREALQHLGFQDITHPDDLRADVAQAEALLAGRVTSYTSEKRYLRGDGGVVWAKLTVSLVRDDDGAPDYFISVVEDISARRRLGQPDDAVLRGLMDGGPNCVTLLDAGGRLLQVNGQTLQALDVAGFETVRGLPLEALWPEGERPAVRRAVAEAQAGRSAAFQAYGMTALGTPKRWAVAVWPLPDGDGRLVAVRHDITEVHPGANSEAHGDAEALRGSEARFRDLVEAMPQPAFIALPDGSNERQNGRWREYTGQDAAEGLGQGWAAALHPDDGPRTMMAWRHALATGQAYSIEHRLRGADGQWRLFLTRALPMREGGAGRILRWIGTCTDVSELAAARDDAARSVTDLEAVLAERTRALSDAGHELAAEMRRREDAQAVLQQSQKLEALGKLTSGVAHDFNNVLSAIIGSYALIRRRVDSPSVLDIVTRGEQAAERAGKLIRQLLSFARKEAMRPAILDPAAVLRGAEDLVRHAAGTQVRCVTDAPDGIWPVLADVQQLEVALLNLAVNARDAMPDGGTLTIAARNIPVAERPRGLPALDHVAISVSDSGHGMTPELVAQVAEPFFTTKPRGKGTGLGLSMVHGFAAQCGGRMRIHSREGFGTMVELILPRSALADAPHGAALPDAAPHGRAMILLVEDDAQLRPATAARLRDLGYGVVEAPSAEAATALVQTMDTLDLVVTEVVMPGADGPALAARLRAERPGLPVLFVSGHEPAPAAEGEAVLRKPYSAAALGDAVLDRLGRRAAPAQKPTERMLARLRQPGLRDLYLAWIRSCAGNALPQPEDLYLPSFGLDEHAYLVAVDGEADQLAFRYLAVGAALAARLGRPLDDGDAAGDLAGQEMLGSLAAAYRRCARQRLPVHQSARYDFGDGAPMRLERLLLPLSAEGQRITHLIGVVLFDDVPAQPSG